ncbi:hypothetical protein [uncultured Jatrophihabitans sp.]|uniref:hypothetical protein n=1 Tax=uncultured Jatrophihabitans sp. TaxID=1610747 RepID=UPI0035CB609D
MPARAEQASVSSRSAGFVFGALARAGREPVIDVLPGVPVWAIDGDGLVVRPGPRLVDGVEALAAILHPDAVPARPDAVRKVTP